MKQILQDMGKGDTYLVEAPEPSTKSGQLTINSTVSLVSVGTERMLVEFGKANLLDKARQQPEKVKMVIDKVRTDGLSTTIDAVRSKLSQPIPLGYSNVGVVKNAGAGVNGIKPGDRVVSNGSHAEIVRVPQNLCARIPENVTDSEAAFTVVASIGLQGIRLAEPTMGEAFVVTGVGLIGLLVVQLLRANGCRVLAIDYDQSKLDLAKEFGAEICNPGAGEDPVLAAEQFSRSAGVDGVIITASTKSSEPVSQAATMCRKRGRIVLVGVTGLELNRADFYEKELSFQVSCSYGPGRYDSSYEEQGNDYPLGFVRWTEQRNFEAILDMMSSGALNVKPLITHQFEFENAVEAYEQLSSDRSSLGILLNYKQQDSNESTTTVKLNNHTFVAEQPVVGFIGAGNYASRILMPAFKAENAQFHSIATSAGLNSVIHGQKFEFNEATSSSDELLSNPEINTVAIATRHNSHARFVIEALKQGKNTFVEKPLALTYEDLDAIRNVYESQQSAEQPAKLMVGFNRRFAPQVVKMKALLDSVKSPKSFIFTMNAGQIPKDHWTQDKDVGGGRLIGEACHYIDLMRHLVGHAIVSSSCHSLIEQDDSITEDVVTISLGFADGSVGAIHYYANGASSFPKERIEAFCSGRVLQLDNFRKLKGFDWPGFNRMNLLTQDKGQQACVSAFLNSVRDGSQSPITAEEIFEVSKVTIDIAEQLRN